VLFVGAGQNHNADGLRDTEGGGGVPLELLVGFLWNRSLTALGG
jgi:hypothetical protein